MLFVLDASIALMDVQCIKLNRALETLLGSFQNRSHLIFCSMGDIDKIRERIAVHLSKSSQVVLNTLYNKSVEYSALTQIVQCKAIVYVEDEHRAGMFTEGNTWFVPLRLFADSGLIQSVLLCENEVDSELYIILAELYMRKEKLRGFVISARPRGGGGSGIPKALAAYVRSEVAPCLCITDSDKFYPEFKRSSSSRHCENVAKVSKVVRHMAIDERELENLIPVEALRKVVDVDSFMDQYRVALDKNPQLWSYLDLKNGTCLEWIRKQDAPTQKYWAEVNKTIERKIRACTKCQDTESDSSHCKCGRIEGLGQGLLASVVSHLSQNDTRMNLKLLSEDNRWEEVAKIVFDFSIGFGGEMVAAN